MEGARIFGVTGVHGNVPLLSLAIHRRTRTYVDYSGEGGGKVTGTSVRMMSVCVDIQTKYPTYSL